MATLSYSPSLTRARHPPVVTVHAGNDTATVVTSPSRVRAPGRPWSAGERFTRLTDKRDATLSHHLARHRRRPVVSFGRAPGRQPRPHHVSPLLSLLDGTRVRPRRGTTPRMCSDTALRHQSRIAAPFFLLAGLGAPCTARPRIN
jgi:hypothetical protein